MVSKRSFGLFFAFIIFSGFFLSSKQLKAAELVNVSARGEAGQGAKQMVVGFVVNGDGRKQIMISAVGPTTEVSEAIENPEFSVLDQETGEEVYYCDDWKNCLGSNIVEAYLEKNGQSLTDNEAAAILSLDAGAYSIEIRDKDGGSGIALGAAIGVPAFIKSNVVSFGTWKNKDESVCFNVVSSRLTAKFSGCPGGASLSFKLRGKTASGNSCKIDSFSEDTISVEEGKLTWSGTINGGDDIEIFSGVFLESRLAIGTVTQVRSGEPLSDACTAEWSAVPYLVN